MYSLFNKCSLILFFLISQIIVVSCSSNEKTYEVKIINGIKTFLCKKNSRKPHSPITNLRFIKRISDVFNILSIDLDSNENIYLLDNKDFQVKKYSKNGDFILNFGKKGIGPGEFNYPNSLFIKNDTIFIIDPPLKSINKFDLDGRFITRTITERSYSNIKRINDSTYIGFEENGFMKKDGFYLVKKFVLLDSYFKIKKILQSKEEKYKNERNFLDVFFPYCFSQKNIFVSSNSDNEYKIKVLNLDGELEYYITKNWRAKEISSKEINDFNIMINSINKKSTPDKLVAKYKKSINGLFYTKDNFLLSKVSHERNEKNNGLFIVDIMNDSIIIGTDTLNSFLGRDFIDRIYEPIFLGNKILYKNMDEGYIDIYDY